MNEGHLEFLASPDWARMLETDVLPWAEEAGDLGEDVLEIGPGPGLTTDLLRQRVPWLTAVEVDESLAVPLRERLVGTNVAVVCADATDSGLESERFSAATCFTMLHHMPTPEHQDRLFAEVHRMLRPGGVFVCTDSLDIDMIREGHIDDIFVPVDPNTLERRLRSAGFADATIDVRDWQFRAVARKRA